MPIVNGVFECIAALLAWVSVYQLLADGTIKGIYWPAVAFAGLWGIETLFYYASLNHWLAFGGACFRVLALLTWTYISLLVIRG